MMISIQTRSGDEKWAMNKHASPSEDITTIIDCYDISLQASLSFS